MTTTLKSNSSDSEINSAVAERVSGWRRYDFCGTLYIFPPYISDRHDAHPSLGFTKTDRKGKVKDPGHGFVDTSKPQIYPNIPDYLHSADAVIELLASKYPHWRIEMVSGMPPAFGCYIWPHGCGHAPQVKEYFSAADTFCRAACFALLRANGVEIK